MRGSRQWPHDGSSCVGADLPPVSLLAFVEGHLPAPRARVLEVGCGDGDLARAIAARGHPVVAIDPRAPRGAIFRSVALEDFAEDGPFDAVVASRSLHHIGDLGGALDRIGGLLRDGGRLIVNEHACDRFDEPTARWYLAHRHRSVTVARCLADWEADHAGLHGSAEMRRELDRRFTERFFAWTPYLYGELGAALEAEERDLIESGTISPTGFRYVGEPRR
jgi:SAM-dependent methyltransferase